MWSLRSDHLVSNNATVVLEPYWSVIPPQTQTSVQLDTASPLIDESFMAIRWIGENAMRMRVLISFDNVFHLLLFRA